ncbi:penicillin-binding transpeptidase domain-containing protein [Streptomyces sp. DSM 44915]|uniref:Penicillin-binding transpeptidase domain-containing protein n=1 Tax=Streptomyces chisholmiae TaxID=3075540 RepID=A0ABU2JQ67_9ACTN|nr:penicillin-binding transpeptidase domain-containing protein [Streptomyces sp. DSM 44915]MDT0267136.1 penicillin-binding transpeptidase domain-containing protein [Streptomyces sp. DSM 44915]
MNKPMRRVAVFCGVLILALLIRVNYVQFVQADELQSHEDNRRVSIERYSNPRGDIIVDGEPITGSVETDDPDYRFQRTWTDGEMWAPVTGYASQAFGTSMLEGVNDSILTGDDDRLFFNNTIDMLTGGDQRGGDVITTLNGDAQRAAFEGLGDRKGAVVALDPRSGAILALASTPSYDPTSFAGYGAEDEEAWVALEGDDEDKPMLNRALRETYPPGSTFKVVTAAAALENDLVGDIDEDTQYDDPYLLPDTNDVPLDNQVPGVCQDANVRDAMRYSCNSVFAGLSNDVGNEGMIEMADRFGFNEEHFVPVRANASVYPEDNRPQNAMAGIGQASNRATPLQMAMVASAVANNGTLMKPYMVDQLVAPNLSVIEQHDPEELREAVSGDTARELQEAMEEVVEGNDMDRGSISGDVRIGGKTGTAQRGENNSEPPYAWFISYAMTDEGSPVAVAVVVEVGDGDVERDLISGTRFAAPIAMDVMAAVLEDEG